MARFKGTETVKGGYYLNLGGGKLEVIEGSEGVLPGGESLRYMRIPVLALVALAPLMGLVFVLLVPFLGAAVLIEQGSLKAYSVASARAARLGRMLSLHRR